MLPFTKSKRILLPSGAASGEKDFRKKCPVEKGPWPRTANGKGSGNRSPSSLASVSDSGASWWAPPRASGPCHAPGFSPVKSV